MITVCAYACVCIAYECVYVSVYMCVVFECVHVCVHLDISVRVCGSYISSRAWLVVYGGELLLF